MRFGVEFINIQRRISYSCTPTLRRDEHGSSGLVWEKWTIAFLGSLQFSLKWRGIVHNVIVKMDFGGKKVPGMDCISVFSVSIGG